MTIDERRAYYLHRSKGNRFFWSMLAYSFAFLSLLCACVIVIYFILLSATGLSPINLIKMDSYKTRIEKLGYKLEPGESLNEAIEFIAKDNKIEVDIKTQGIDGALKVIEADLNPEPKTESESESEKVKNSVSV